MIGGVNCDGYTFHISPTENTASLQTNTNPLSTYTEIVEFYASDSDTSTVVDAIDTAYADEAVLSVSIPPTLSWTGVRLVCTKSAGSTTPGSNMCWTNGPNYLTCGSKSVLAATSTSTNTLLAFNDVSTMINADARPRCVLDSSTNKLYVRYSGLVNNALNEYYLRVVFENGANNPSASVDTKHVDFLQWIPAMRIKTTCGCAGSIGTGASAGGPMVIIAKQPWKPNWLGKKWELLVTDDSRCETKVAVKLSTTWNPESFSGDATCAERDSVNAASKILHPLSNSEWNSVGSEAPGTSKTFCVKFTAPSTGYESAEKCITQDIAYTAVVTGQVATAGSSSVNKAKVWLVATNGNPQWDGWQQVHINKRFTSGTSLPASYQRNPTSLYLSLSACKVACKDILLCVAIDHNSNDNSCRLFGLDGTGYSLWDTIFKEGTESAHVPYEGFKSTMLESSSGTSVYIHRAMAVSSGSDNQNFEIKLMTNQIAMATPTFSVNVWKTTGSTNHQFLPASATLVISVGHQTHYDMVANSQQIVDQSSVTFAGKVYHVETDVPNVNSACGVDGAVVTAVVNGGGNDGQFLASVSVGTDGLYTLSLPHSTPLRVSAQFTENLPVETCGNTDWLAANPADTSCLHTMSQNIISTGLTAGSSGLSNQNFIDTQKKDITITVAGGLCAFPIGVPVMDPLVASGSRCPSYSANVGAFAFPHKTKTVSVPAMSYQVRFASLSSPESGIDATKVASFFNNMMGSTQIDLYHADSGSMDFIYRIEPTIVVELPSDMPQCQDFSVLNQGQEYNATITTTEKYGSNVCGDASLPLQIQDPISIEQSPCNPSNVWGDQTAARGSRYCEVTTQCVCDNPPCSGTACTSSKAVVHMLVGNPQLDGNVPLNHNGNLPFQKVVTATHSYMGNVANNVVATASAVIMGQIGIVSSWETHS